MLNFFKRGLFGSRAQNALKYTLVSFEKAEQMIQGEEVTLIDVRTEKEYKAFHIKNAINISVEQICSGNIDFSKDTKIMLYCATGTRSKSAIKCLNNLGYYNIYIWEYASLATFPYKKMLVYNN